MPIEGVFLQIYTTDFLNPTFDILYQESMRGNHILFDHEKVVQWSNLSMGHPTRKQVALVESCFIEILGKVAVKDMKRVIDSQTDDVKYWLFRLYLTYLSSLKAEIKSLSN